MPNELTEQAIFDAFGIEQPQQQETPAEQQPEAEPTEEQPQQEVTPDEEDASEPAAEPEGEAKPEQSVEERRANAARRREKERKEAVDRAVAAEREKAEAEKRDAIDAVYRKLGYEGEADYQRKQAEEAAELRERAVRRMGLSKEEGDVLFPPLPAPEPEPQTHTVGPAGQGGEFAPAGQTSHEADEPFQGDYGSLERQLAEINKLDPSIKTLEDLRAKPWCEDMAKALNARQFGTDEGRLLRAYKVFAQEEIINARLADARKAGRQEALNQQAGKEHLAPARDRTGAGLPEVPKETLTAYQQLMPGLTYEQYQKEYARTLKATK